MDSSPSTTTTPVEAAPSTTTTTLEAAPINNHKDDEDSAEEDDSQTSGFVRFKTDTDFEMLVKLVSDIKTAFEETTTSIPAGDPAAGSEIPDANSNNGSVPVNPPASATTTTTTTGNGITEAGSNSVPDAPPTTVTGYSNTPNGDVADSSAAWRRKEKLIKDVKHIRMNVEYIKKNVNDLEKSPNRDRAEELLHYLMDAAKNQKADDFSKDSENLKHLLHIIAKLKHWVPPQRVVAAVSTKKKNNKEKKESPILSKADKDNAAAEIVKKLVSYDCKDWGMDGLLKSYGELKVRDKLCLLCFSVFLCDVNKVWNKVEKVWVSVQKNLVIKKKILIYWWVGEGFIQPIQPKPSRNPNSTTNTVPQIIPTPDSEGQNPNPINIPSSNPDSSTNVGAQGIPIPDLASVSANQNPNPITNPSSNPDASTNADPQSMPIPNHSPITEGNQISEETWPPPEDEGKTIEQIGENILHVLREKGFIEPVMKRGRESGSYQMHPFVQSFVTALAKKAGFFDFSNIDGKLTHRFALSQRACLLKSQGKLPSSCRKWKEAIDNRDELKKFATVQTLFNVNESIIDIKPEWFSKMNYLSVIHLGSWRSEAGEHIEVEDTIFMEELKNMKQLKLFSLQGVATVIKLPDSVCKLSNLIILDLRECHNLEELPANIGELKNLTHLDITNCHLLTKLPKGISLLSKLEVLNWFVIYNQEGEKEVQKGCMSRAWKKSKGFVVHDVFRRENKEVCTLRDLLKLGSLRELSIVVNRNEFPSKYEVEVLTKMKELRTLKISWVYDVNNDNEKTGPVQPPSKCGCCFSCKKSEDTQEGGPDMSQMRFEKLEKLELWCFPGETLPGWLVPDNLKKLKKLYIKGGKLKSLGVDGDIWSVETLRLKYMKELKIEWRKLIAMFPKMTYLEKFQCKGLGLFPCGHEGVWLAKERIVNHAV